MLQAFLILPAFGLAYLVAGKPALGKRLVHSVLALVALIVERRLVDRDRGADAGLGPAVHRWVVRTTAFSS